MTSISTNTSLRCQTLRFLLFPRRSLQRDCGSRRTFSVSAPKEAISAVDVALAGPSALLDGLHAVGIPWYATVPISAVLARVTFGYYFGMLPARRKALIRRNLYPVLSSQLRTEARQAAIETAQNRSLSSGSKGSSQISRLRKLVVLLKTNYLLPRSFGVPVFPLRNFTNFGILIAFTEAIRIKCGTNQGLLPLILSPFEWLRGSLSRWWNGVTHSQATDEASHNAGTIPASEVVPVAGEIKPTSQLEAIADPELHGQALAEIQNTTNATGTSYISADPTFHTEGLSWCQDLTMTDSTFILPVALSFAMAARALLRSPSTTAAAKTNRDSRNSKALDDSRGPLAHLAGSQRFSLSVALLFFFVGLNLPSGILLYFISSVVTGMMQARWLDIKYPLPEPIRPCRRPLRLRVRKSLGDL